MGLNRDSTPCFCIENVHGAHKTRIACSQTRKTIFSGLKSTLLIVYGKIFFFLMIDTEENVFFRVKKRTRNFARI